MLFDRSRVLAVLLTVGASATCLTLSSIAAEPDGFYDPIEKQVEGWTVAIDPQLLAEENREVGDKALQALANHLQRITYIMPEDRLAEVKKLRIWVDLHYDKLGNMQYHPSRGWLVGNGHDPRLAKHVHIPRAKQLYDPHMWAKHPYVVLHELAHAYHDQVLSFDDPEIIAAYKQAKQLGSYESVLLFNGAKVRHYGMTDHKEYFAEATEAYFGVNDFYPFVRAELKEHDPDMFALMEKIWGQLK
jgi:dipeptidyl-peptidase-4